jgi:hypothetical protein
MKTKKTKKGLLLGLSTIVAGVSIFVASSTASASMSASASCTGPKTEHSQGGTYCKCMGEASCRDNSGCGGGIGDIIKDILGL